MMIRLLAWGLITAASAVAGNVSRRHSQSIKTTPDTISSQLLKMNVAFAELQNWTGDDFCEFENASNPLALNATEVIEASRPLSFED